VDTAEIGAAGAGLTNINLPNQTMDIVGNITGNLSGSVGSVTGAVGSVTGAVGSVTGNVGGNVTGSVGSLATQAKADVNAEADAAIETYHLDHLLAVTYDPASKPGAADALLNELVESDAGVARYTANALEQAPTGGSAPTAAAIADAVWEEALADHEGTAGSTAEALADAGGSGASAADIADAVWDEATAGHTTGGSFGAQTKTVLDARASQTSVDDLPTNAELATALGTADDATLAAIAALNNLSSAQAQTAAAAALTAYDPPTRAEATTDKAEILTAVGDVPTNAELATALAAADDAVLAAIAALNNISAAQVNAQVVDALAVDTYAEPASVPAAIAALNNISAAQVNAQVVDALAVDTYAEPASVPAATATLAAKISWLAVLARNKVTQSANVQILRNDADSGQIGQAAVSDDGTTFTRAEWQ
jgi:hypothetical protein